LENIIDAATPTNPKKKHDPDPSEELMDHFKLYVIEVQIIQ